MKKINKILTFALVLCFSAFALVGLAGCGSSAAETLAKNFETLEGLYEEYSQIFTSGDCAGYRTKYLINYGDKINSQVRSEKSAGESLYGYLDLETKYNKIFAISSQYIDDHKEYLIALSQQEDNAKQVTKALNNINKKMKSFINELNVFVTKRNELVDRFRRVSENVTENTSLAHIRRFKRDYGEFLKANMEVSGAIAETIEATDVFGLMKEAGMTEENTKTVRDYVGIKMLPIFYGFLVEKIENQIYWDATPDTDDKWMIDSLLKRAEQVFSSYVSNYVNASSSMQELDAEEVKMMFDMVDVFFAETKAYNKALDGMDFAKMANRYDNELVKYKKKNVLAETYMAKIKQFFMYSVDNFMNEFNSYIY